MTDSNYIVTRISEITGISVYDIDLRMHGDDFDWQTHTCSLANAWFVAFGHWFVIDFTTGKWECDDLD